jgi:cell wall assembly regulator SMI1
MGRPDDLGADAARLRGDGAGVGARRRGQGGTPRNLEVVRCGASIIPGPALASHAEINSGETWVCSFVASDNLQVGADHMADLFERWQKLAALIRSNAPPRSLGIGASSSEIARCEESLRVSLPQSFRWFLNTFGALTWPDYIYGIVPANSAGLSVEENARQEREETDPPMPLHLVPFAGDGWGNSFCLDTSRLEEGECPIVFWNHEREGDQQPVTTHSSFLEWLEEVATAGAKGE